MKIEPCPFCDGTAKLHEAFFMPCEQFDSTGNYIGYSATLNSEIYPAYVECERCHATGPSVEEGTDEEDVNERAIKYWNGATGYMRILNVKLEHYKSLKTYTDCEEYRREGAIGVLEDILEEVE